MNMSSLKLIMLLCSLVGSTSVSHAQSESGSSVQAVSLANTELTSLHSSINHWLDASSTKGDT